MDVAYNIPNEYTIAAMKEAKDDSNLSTVNMKDYNSVLQSLDLK